MPKLEWSTNTPKTLINFPGSRYKVKVCVSVVKRLVQMDLNKWCLQLY